MRCGVSEAAIDAMRKELEAKRARVLADKPRGALLELSERRARELANTLIAHPPT